MPPGQACCSILCCRDTASASSDAKRARRYVITLMGCCHDTATPPTLLMERATAQAYTRADGGLGDNGRVMPKSVAWSGARSRTATIPNSELEASIATVRCNVMCSSRDDMRSRTTSSARCTWSSCSAAPGMRTPRCFFRASNDLHSAIHPSRDLDMTRYAPA